MAAARASHIIRRPIPARVTARILAGLRAATEEAQAKTARFALTGQVTR